MSHNYYAACTPVIGHQSMENRKQKEVNNWDAKEIVMLNGLTGEDNRLVTDNNAKTLLRNVVIAFLSFAIPCSLIQIDVDGRETKALATPPCR
jgi:hypothetical protein